MTDRLLELEDTVQQVEKNLKAESKKLRKMFENLKKEVIIINMSKKVGVTQKKVQSSGLREKAEHKVQKKKKTQKGQIEKEEGKEDEENTTSNVWSRSHPICHHTAVTINVTTIFTTTTTTTNGCDGSKSNRGDHIMCLQSIQRETMRVDGVDNTFKKPDTRHGYRP